MLVYVDRSNGQINWDYTFDQGTSGLPWFVPAGRRATVEEAEAANRSLRYGVVPDGLVKGSPLHYAWQDYGIPQYTGGAGGNASMPSGLWPPKVGGQTGGGLGYSMPDYRPAAPYGGERRSGGLLSGSLSPKVIESLLVRQPADASFAASCVADAALVASGVALADFNAGSMMHARHAIAWGAMERFDALRQQYMLLLGEGLEGGNLLEKIRDIQESPAAFALYNGITEFADVFNTAASATDPATAEVGPAWGAYVAAWGAFAQATQSLFGNMLAGVGSNGLAMAALLKDGGSGLGGAAGLIEALQFGPAASTFQSGCDDVAVACNAAATVAATETALGATAVSAGLVGGFLGGLSAYITAWQQTAVVVLALSGEL